MQPASLALGFGLGVLASGLLATLAATLSAAVAWRWAKALDRGGINIDIRQDPPTP